MSELCFTEAELMEMRSIYLEASHGLRESTPAAFYDAAEVCQQAVTLATRVSQLEDAVRWAWNRTIGSAVFVSSLWLATHPIVREVIEGKKGGE